MNVRKPTDYSNLFAAVDRTVSDALPQMELYREIGRLICERPEKGAAVAAAEYLQSAYPDISGFSPRNVRRMREFYRTYENAPAVMREAMELGWTQNVVILEAELSLPEREWYIRAARRFGWSKLALTEKIAERTHENIAIDNEPDLCYTASDEKQMEEKSDQGALLLSREYLSQPDGGVCDEGFGEESEQRSRILHRIRGLHQRGDREPGLPSGPPQTVGTWHRLHRQNRPPDDAGGLRTLRPTDRDGRREYVGYAPHLRRRFRQENPSADGVCRTPRFRSGRPLVHPRLRRHMARC